MKNGLFTKAWWKAAGIRALKTLIQSAIALIGTATLLSEIDIRMVLSGSVLAAILSLLTSIMTGLPEVEGGETDDGE